MRVKKLKTFGSMREFIVYDSIEDFTKSGRDKEELIYWKFLPRYSRRKTTDVAYVLERLEALDITGKMLVTTDNHVIPVVGIKKQINRKRQLVAVYLDTAYGRFELKYEFKCREGIGIQVQYHHQALVSNIAAAGDFWTGFAVSYPVHWAKLQYDPFQAIRWMKRRDILNHEFFERLRREMNDEGYLKLVEQMLPTVAANKAATECMTQSENLKVKSDTALGVMEIAVEVMKMMDKPFAPEKGGNGTTAGAFPVPTDNLPQPFIPVDKKNK